MGLVFVIWRIVSQHDFNIMDVRELCQTPHKLSPLAGVMRLVIQVDNQLPDMLIFVFIAFPPVFNAINDKIAGFKRDPKECHEQSRHHFQNTKGD